MMMFMSPTLHSFTDFVRRVSILCETYHYFAIACSFLQLIFTLQFLHNFYIEVDVNIYSGNRFITGNKLDYDYLGLLMVEGNTFMQKFYAVSQKLTLKTTDAIRIF